MRAARRAPELTARTAALRLDLPALSHEQGLWALEFLPQSVPGPPPGPGSGWTGSDIWEENSVGCRPCVCLWGALSSWLSETP